MNFAHIFRFSTATCIVCCAFLAVSAANQVAQIQTITLDGNAPGPRFDGIGVVNGGGATSVLLKDYPEPQRSQILDYVCKPKLGASVSALFVEIPGDGNSTQGSMPSHMRTRDDLNYSRGYTWWILREACRRNPRLTLDGTAWSAPGWIGNGEFWSQDAADYYVNWLQGLRTEYGLQFAALGCRNEKGVSFSFAKTLRATLDQNGFEEIELHAFDNWPADKFDWTKELKSDPELRDAVDILGAHVLYSEAPATSEVQQLAIELNKPIWNTEEHVYKKGFDCQISIVEAFNDSYIKSGATKIVNWYDIAGVYPLEPYSEDPATLLAHWPWCGHYEVREALWGYAHYGQFTEVGWRYLTDACGGLGAGGSYVSLASPQKEYSIIIETKDAKAPQKLRFQVAGGLADKSLCVWRSNEREQFVQQASITPADGKFAITLEPDSIYSLSTTTGQQKGSFDAVPPAKPFPFPYQETFDGRANPQQWGYLPRFMADIEEVFEVVRRPDGSGWCLQQVVPLWPHSWAPSWQPYTIIGDREWHDYAVSADVYLNPGDAAGVMGRINHVGFGYGTIPQGYFLKLSADGLCELVVVRGKVDKQKLVGDAEQRAAIQARNDASSGGELVLASAQVANVTAGKWHNLTLRFAGTSISGLVDGQQVMTVTNDLYSGGMAGLLACEGEGKQLSMPYYDNFAVREPDGDANFSTPTLIDSPPLYDKLEEPE